MNRDGYKITVSMAGIVLRISNIARRLSIGAKFAVKNMRIYLDSSVINFLFVTDAPDFRAVTLDFFENHADRHELFISDVVLLEMERDPDPAHRALLFSTVEKYEIEVLDDTNRGAVLALARLYIEQGAIPKNKVEDAQHVAYATIHEMDVLVSWNFKHLANVNREAKILTVNMEAGYRYPLRLLSPLEVTYEF